MSQLRYDLATNDWVIFSPSRALRPKDGGSHRNPRQRRRHRRR